MLFGPSRETKAVGHAAPWWDGGAYDQLTCASILEGRDNVRVFELKWKNDVFTMKCDAALLIAACHTKQLTCLLGVEV